MTDKKELHRRARKLRANMTDAEQKLWKILRLRQMGGCRFRRQMVIGQYIVDFCCPQIKMIVEVDGGQHQQNRDYDNDRTRWLMSQGYKVLRFWNNQVLKKSEDVAAVIFASIE